LDVHLQFTEPIEVLSVEGMAFQNPVGSVNSTLSATADGKMLHWHFEHVLGQIWLDSSNHGHYQQLMEAIRSPEHYKIIVRKKS